MLGPWAFGALFVPANVVAALHVIHFNWASHNASSASGEYGPVNLDRGYFWVGNRIWHGIYFHANPHRRTNAFNPMRAPGQVAQVSAQAAGGSRSGHRRAA